MVAAKENDCCCISPSSGPRPMELLVKGMFGSKRHVFEESPEEL